MPQFAVMHTTKLGNGAGGIGSHIDRTQKKLPKNVDPKRVHLNKEYVATGGTMYQDIKRRIENGYAHTKKDGSLRAIRKDAVKAVGIALTGSNERMKELEKDGLLDSWTQANLEFMEAKVGKENIVRFTLHRDEKTPHIHCVFTPLDNEGRLCAKEIVGNKEKLSNLQSDYAEAMKPFGLERGIKHSRMKHTTTREYYRDINQAAAEIEIQTNVMGQPKKGEEERLQELYKAIAMQVYESKRLLKKERNLRPQWENEIKAQHQELKGKNEEFDSTLSEAKRIADNQNAIISKNITEHVNAEKARLEGIFEREVEKMEESYKQKESIVDEMIKSRHINKTLGLVNHHLKKEFGANYEIKYNEKTDKFYKESLNKKRDKGYGIGGR